MINGDGYGYGNSYRYSCGNSYGDGNGNGNGYRYSCGDGDGNGNGYGNSYGDGYGDGNGYGYSYGDDYGYSYGDGNGNGDGDGYGNAPMLTSYLNEHHIRLSLVATLAVRQRLKPTKNDTGLFNLTRRILT